MKLLKRYPYFVFLLVTTLFVSENLFAQVEFIENKGQWDPSVKFMSSAGSGSFFLTGKGFAITQYNADDIQNVKIKMHEATSANTTANREKKGDSVRADAYSVQFLNALTPVIQADKELPSVTNYFIGNDKSKWASNCKSYLAVTYKNIYPNIDLRYYTDASGNLKYDFIVHPGAKIDDIAMKYKGAQKLGIKDRELNVTTSLGVNKELKPYTYQVVDNQKKELDCRYVIKGDVVKFKVKNYSPDQTLIIDPTLVFFSYSGSTADNWGFTATYGKDGSFYGGGIAFGLGFPVSSGAYNQSFKGDFDIAIIKLTPNGHNRIYATYIGGNGADQPHSLIEDPQGNLIIAGRSSSSNYPTTATAGSGGGFDIVVTELNATGSAIIGSMKIGGSGDDGVNIADDHSNYLQSLKRNYGDDARSEVLLDASNNIYVASCSSSGGTPGTSGAFPTTPGAFQTQLKGKQDAVVLKLDPTCNSLLFSTLLGGSDNDAAYVLTIGNNGSVYVAGGTASPDFFANIPTANVIRPTNAALGSADGKDPCDGFVVELNSSGTKAIRGTYIGTEKADQIYGIETDKFGYIYVMGTSEGDMKVIDPPNEKAYFNPGGKQFISKLKPDLSDFVYSTVFGSPNSQVPNISPTAFLVDRCQNVYVSGWGGKSNGGFSTGNTKGLPVTPDAIKPRTDASGSDFYFIVLKKNVDSLLYGTFFGQEDPPGRTKPVTFGDHVDGGTSRFDKNGVIYQAICANCFKSVAFPGTPGAFSKSNQSEGQNGACNLGMLKIEMDFAGVRSGLHTSINGVSNDTAGCVPLMVDFTDTLKKGKRYYWYFGDGTGDTTTVPATSHVYENVGKYPVMLVTIDSATCNIADTSYKTIKAGDNRINLDFLSQKLQPCTNLSYDFTNKSKATRGSFNPGIFTWNFGDNSPLLIQDQNPVTHAFAGPGTYKVTLSVDDTTYCNSPADTVKTIRLSPQVKASFSTPANGCVPYDAAFDNNSLGGINFVWDFGDGTTSTDDSPTHLYSKTGSYKVKLTAYDSSSCNKINDSSFTITVSPIPTASFTYNPLQPKENTFTNFVNQSIGASHYSWSFGDGDTSTLENPRHIYEITDSYRVCLNASNDVGCSDDTCQNVSALVKPLVDLPSAFTPGKFGANGIIRVVGFGIKEMKWTIYNRWGQKVYESNNLKDGWDGTFNGKLQPMDVYTYTLGVTFSTGQKVTKTGDITLLR
ncbi:MAG: PKD domain-containing protein [Ginsengibacter sp.]